MQPPGTGGLKGRWREPASEMHLQSLRNVPPKHWLIVPEALVSDSDSHVSSVLPTQEESVKPPLVPEMTLTGIVHFLL